MAAASNVRLTELLAALSMAVDLGLGQPAGHVARSAVVAARLNDRLGQPADRTVVFDLALLGRVGCIADSREAARWFGDDIDYRAGVYDVDMKPLPFLGYLLRRAGSADPLPVRIGKKTGVLIDGGRSVQDSLRAHCQVTAQVARRLGMPEVVAQPSARSSRVGTARACRRGSARTSPSRCASGNWPTWPRCTTPAAAPTPSARCALPGAVASSTPSWWTRHSPTSTRCSPGSHPTPPGRRSWSTSVVPARRSRRAPWTKPSRRWPTGST